MIDDRRIGEASSLRRCPGWHIGGGGLLTQRSVAACGLVLDLPLLATIRSAARTPLTFTIQDIANRLPAGAATEACRVAW
jgi:hypothetical protein